MRTERAGRRDGRVGRRRIGRETLNIQHPTLNIQRSEFGRSLSVESFRGFERCCAKELTRMLQSRHTHALPDLINTPLQRGVGDGGGVETVSTVLTHWRKPWKRLFPACDPLHRAEAR